jgi:hypothetical protein
MRIGRVKQTDDSESRRGGGCLRVEKDGEMMLPVEGKKDG